MTKRDVIHAVIEGRKPPYVPWSFGFTLEAHEKLVEHFGSDDLETIFGNHLLGLGNGVGFFDDIGFSLYERVDDARDGKSDDRLHR